jgi:SAM-dependent methyltransferase
VSAPHVIAPTQPQPRHDEAARSRVSDELLRFTAAVPHERQSILEFALRVAQELPPGSRLIDVGAGNSPYRELFGHLAYESSDWEHSPHPGARAVDHIGPAHAIPVQDRSYDAVLCTQVLEHVPNPGEVLRELHRILRPGGRLYMTVPLAWELHELPFDFFRYTPSGLAAMLGDAGFERLDIRPRNDCFSTAAQLLENLASAMGSYPDGRDQRRLEAVAALHSMSARLASYADLDARMILPLGYSVAARRPGAQPRPAPVRDRAAAGLGDARSFVTLCFAADVLADPRVLRAYATRFAGADDATLAIYAPNCDPASAGERLLALVGELGLDGPESPDMIALPSAGRPDERALAAAVDAVLAPQPPWGAFAGLPWAHAGTLAEIHRAAQP